MYKMNTSSKIVILASIPITFAIVLAYIIINNNNTTTTTIPSSDSLNNDTDAIYEYPECINESLFNSLREHALPPLNSRISDYFPLDYTSRISDHIIIGTINDFGGISKPKLTPDILISLSSMTVSVERDLTGHYSKREMIVRTAPGELRCLMPGDKVLLFIRIEREEEGRLVPFPGGYFMIMGMIGAYKIVDDKAYGYYHPDGIELEELIRLIEQARSERIKDITMRADYIILGRITKIEPTPLYIDPDEDVDEKNILTANFTIEVEEELTGNYNGDVMIFFGDRDWSRCKIGDRCIVFLKYGTNEYYEPLINNDKISPYYAIYLESPTNGYYKIMDDNKAYGDEFPEGIDVDMLIAKIKEYRSNKSQN